MKSLYFLSFVAALGGVLFGYDTPKLSHAQKLVLHTLQWKQHIWIMRKIS